MKKNLLLGLVAIATTGLIVKGVQANNKKVEEQQDKAVEQYITCLKESNGQRSYCAREQGTTHYVMDDLAKQRGYKFSITKSGDLKIEKEDK